MSVSEWWWVKTHFNRFNSSIHVIGNKNLFFLCYISAKLHPSLDWHRTLTSGEHLGRHSGFLKGEGIYIHRKHSYIFLLIDSVASYLKTEAVSLAISFCPYSDQGGLSMVCEWGMWPNRRNSQNFGFGRTFCCSPFLSRAAAFSRTSFCPSCCIISTTGNIILLSQN